MRKLLLSVCLISLASLNSCAEAPVAPPTEDPAIRAGSTFTFEHKVYEDSLWTDLTSTDSLVSTVTSIDTAIGGQLHAHFMASVFDTSIYRVLAGGDVSLYQPTLEIAMTDVTLPASWSALPINTKQASITTFEDETATTIQTQAGSTPAIVYTSLKTGYVGPGSISIDGETYATEEAFIERYIGVGVMGRVSYTRVRSIYSYSPELKTFVARNQKAYSNHDYSPIPNGSETWTLVSFTL